jgi:putative FmdB family regulatory protein
MPVYEYQCEKCGKILEVFQLGLAEKPPKSCPECGGKDLPKIMSLPGMVRCENPAAGESAWRIKGKEAEKAGEKSTEKSEEKSSEKTGEKTGKKTSEKAGKKDKVTGSGKGKSCDSSPRSSGGVGKKADAS